MHSAPPTIFSQQRRRARAERHRALAGSATDPAQFLRAEMIADVTERLEFMQVEAGTVGIVGDLPGGLGAALATRGHAVTTLDAATYDPEQPWPQPGCNLIVSLGQLDTVNDLPGALLHLRRALPPGGLFIGCFTGAGSLAALRQILLAADGDRPAARIHPQIDVSAASSLMQRANFSRQVIDSLALSVRYRSFESMIADIRAQGMGNVLADTPPPFTRAALARARDAFARLSDEDGRVTETFEIVTVTGWG